MNFRSEIQKAVWRRGQNPKQTEVR